MRTSYLRGVDETNSLRQEVIGDKRILKDELEVQDGIIKHAELTKQATEQNYRTVLEVHRNREAQLQEYAQGRRHLLKL
jgi:hypothetical protein